MLLLILTACALAILGIVFIVSRRFFRQAPINRSELLERMRRLH